jgi:hypothetical protein
LPHAEKTSASVMRAITQTNGGVNLTGVPGTTTLGAGSDG